MKKELENLSESDEKLRQMLASLNQVEAPKDFEFRLKARIANASPRAYRTNYKRRFAFALPASALAITSAFMLINGSFFSNGNQISSAPETTVQSGFAPQTQNPPDESMAADTIINKKSEEALTANSNVQNRRDEKINLPLTAVKLPEKPKNEAPRESKKENNGFSKDIAVAPPPKVFKPKGINPETKLETPKDFSVEKDFSVQDLMSPLGAEVVSENGKWKVKSVNQNSQAERLGIKTDDVIETLNGQKIPGASLRGKKIEVKKLGVKRGGEQVEINLQGNPK